MHGPHLRARKYNSTSWPWCILKVSRYNRSTIMYEHSSNDDQISTTFRRHLEEGTTIISSPMIHVWGRETMDFNLTLVDGDIPINPSMQLLNYQFSHPKSSVYFLPINQMIAINHNSARTVHGQPPNAKLRWASWNKKSVYALQRPLDDLKKVRLRNCLWFPLHFTHFILGALFNYCC